MSTSTCHKDHETHASDVLIPLIRTAATIGFAIAPCSLGFVIIAVSEQIIRSIMVGDDPVMLVSDLQNQFPNAAIKATEQDEELVSQVVSMVESGQGVAKLPANVRVEPRFRV